MITRFNLGYDSKYNKSTGGKIWKTLIIPTSKNTYVARNTDPKADKEDRYRKCGGSVIYNEEVLQTAQKPIFITEGEIDALSIITAGGEAIALGSTSNCKKLLKLLESVKPSQILLLALDNDPEGQKATAELIPAWRYLIKNFGHPAPEIYSMTRQFFLLPRFALRLGSATNGFTA